MKKTSLVFIMAASFAGAANAEVFDVAQHAPAVISSPFVGGQGDGGNPLLAGGVSRAVQAPVGIQPSDGHIAEFKPPADGSGAYRTEYRQGGVWKTAWDVPTVAWWWLMTRQNDLVSPVTAAELRPAPADGGGYRAAAIEPIAAEPEEWSMMLVGTGLLAFQLRRKQKQA
ncbi:MAG: hypothetical protein ACOYMG_05245 [Candidatus Methylumidiphilus sp.]